jgi:hypothetical protein
MPSLTLIESNCRCLAALRGQLRQKFEAKQRAQGDVDAAHNPGIRELETQCLAARTELLANLNASREFFLERKTREFHGLMVGFEKERDRLTLPPEEILVDRIEKILPAAQGETLLDRTAKVIKQAFKKLPMETLQKLGCAVVKGGDKSIIRANDDDIETLVHKTLGSAAEPEA